MKKSGFEESRFASARESISAAADSALALSRHGFLRGPAEDFRRVYGQKRAETRLHVAVCGAYSSGKSTLVSFLTGRDDIAIGTGVTTDQTAEYDCGDWTIVDTPGICADRPEHDERSHRYMERADLLVYMIHAAKGFTPAVKKDFLETIRKRYAGKTMLVMGRLGDEEEANLPAKRREVSDVLGGEEQMEAFRFCLLDVQDYQEGVRDGDGEQVADSHMAEFRERLEDFLRRKGAYGKCLALLDVVDGFADRARALCLEQADRDEIARRQGKALQSAMTRYRRTFEDARNRLLEFVASERRELLSLYPEQGDAFREKVQTFAGRIQQAAEDPVFRREQESLFADLKAELDDIDEQVVRLDKRFSLAFGGNLGGVQGFDLGMWQQGAKGIGNALAGLDRELFVKIVHFFGGKFKPWGVGKWLKALRGVGKGLGPAVEIAGQAAERRAERLAEEGCGEIKRTFAEIEESIREFYGGWEGTEAYRQMAAAKERLDAAERNRRRTNAEKEAALAELEALQRRTAACRAELEAW